MMVSGICPTVLPPRYEIEAITDITALESF
jgi:hypothetical protein